MNALRRSVRLLLVLLAPATLGGCGTVLSLFEAPQPYGGVHYDVAHFDEVVLSKAKMGDDFRCGFGSTTDGRAVLLLFALILTRPIWCAALLGVDIGLSAIADTIILPLMLLRRR